MSSRRPRSETKRERSKAPNAKGQGELEKWTNSKIEINSVAVRSAGPSTSKSAPIKRKLADSKNSKHDHKKKAKSQETAGGIGNESSSGSESEPKPGPSSSISGKIAQVQGPCPTQALSVDAAKTMHNELILDLITKKLPRSNLLTLRETCLSWNRTFLPQLRTPNNPKHKLVRLYTDSSRSYRHNDLLLSDFTKTMGSSTSFPCGAFKIQSIYKFGWGPTRDLSEFFTKFGKTITRLDLSLQTANTTTINGVRRMVFEWVPNVLQELSLCAVMDFPTRTTSATTPKDQLEPLKKEIPKLRKLAFSVSIPDHYHEYFELCKDMFQCATGLEHLSLDTTRNSMPFLRILRILPTESEHLHRLKRLEVPRLKAVHLRLLIQLGSRFANPLQLQELEMTCRDTQIQGSSDAEMVALIYQFLATQSNTLRILKIAIDGWNVQDGERSRHVVSLPRIVNLHSLTLQRNIRWQLAVQCEEESLGSCANNFPKLKRLEFINERHDRTNREITTSDMQEVDIEKQFGHDGVTSLKIETYREEINARRALPVSILPSAWPSVSKIDLQLPIQRQALFNFFRSFCTLWPGLISLRIELVERTGWRKFRDLKVDLDELLSGVLPSKFSAIRGQLASNPDIHQLRAMQTKFKTKPAISDLGQLQEFVLDPGHHKYNITDIGGYLGLALMSSPAVQHVALIQQKEDQPSQKKVNSKIKNPAGNCISEECRTFMRSIFGLNAVIDL